MKGVYIETKNKLTRHQFDSCTGHSEEWKQIHSFYHSENEELGEITGNYTVFNYDSDEPPVYDLLTVDEVQYAVSYINYEYGEAKREKIFPIKTKTSHHQTCAYSCPFGSI